MSKVMNGSIEYPMSQRIKDTIKVHGEAWTYLYYVKQHGLTWWEFGILAGYSFGLVMH